MTAAPLRLAAVNAGATVTLTFREHHVPASRVMSIEPFADWRLRDAGGLRMNGSLSLGLTARCCALLGPSRFDAELGACRADLDAAVPESMPSARAAASDLAVRAASAVVVAGGGRSILVDQQAQRLAREATFLLVFGQTPAIRAAQRQARPCPPGLPRQGRADRIGASGRGSSWKTGGTTALDQSVIQRCTRPKRYRTQPLAQ